MLPSTEKHTTRFITVADWNKYHLWPSQSGLRYYVHNCKKNGFDAVIKRVGRRVLLDENAFFEWVAQNGGQKNELQETN